jgi:quinol monooxygenase YgiN
MTSHYGFLATITAQPGKGADLIALLLDAPSLANDDCLVFLVARSAGNPDLVFVTEGWADQEAHARFFGSDVAQAYLARFAALVAGQAAYVGAVPVGGKAVLV